MEQILINLAVNARDAMINGGRMTLETRNVSIGDDTASAHPIMISGEYIMLAVSDTGNGMDKELEAHIFEPFFTTREAGKGTGLGLATVYGIVKQSGGCVEIDSHPGCGTTFKIYLPRIGGRAEHQTAAKLKSASGGFETILLVERSAPSLELMCGFLEAEGYNVLSSANPVEAIRIAQHHDRPISLLTSVSEVA